MKDYYIYFFAAFLWIINIILCIVLYNNYIAAGNALGAFWGFFVCGIISFEIGKLKENNK